MTQTSRFWDGSAIGDAVTAPYDAGTEFSKVLNSISGAAGVATHLSAVFVGELNALAVSGAATPVTVGTGRAMVWGAWYENDAATTVVVPTPSAATRIDRIVLRKDWALQTVRVTRVAGAEGGGAPALTQIAGTTWDMPIAQISITTGGVITITDQRSYVGGERLPVPSGTNSILTSTGGVALWDDTPTIGGLLTLQAGINVTGTALFVAASGYPITVRQTSSAGITGVMAQDNAVVARLYSIWYNSTYVGNNSFAAPAASTGEVSAGGPLYVGTYANSSLFLGANSTVKLTVAATGLVTQAWVAGGLLWNNVTAGTDPAYGEFVNNGGLLRVGLDSAVGVTTSSAYAGMIWHTGATRSLIFGTNSLARITISSAGLVTFSPTAGQLIFDTASQGTNYALARFINTGGILTVGIDNSIGGIYSSGNYATVFHSTVNGPMIFATNNVVRLTLSAAGVATFSGQLLVGGVALGTENLLTNPGFEVWQRGAGPFTTNGVYAADRWITGIGTSSCSVTRIASTIGSKGFSAQIVYTHVGGGSFSFSQKLENFTPLQGRTITFSCKVKSTVAATIRLWIYDSVNTYRYSSYNVGTGEETLSVTATIDAATTNVTLGMYSLVASCTFEMNDAVCVMGSVPADYVPRTPADELAQCLRYYEVLGSSVVGEVFAVGFAYAAGSAMWVIPFKAIKAIIPTVTYSASGDFGPTSSGAGGLPAFTNTTAGSGSGLTQTSMFMAGSSGMVAGNATFIQAINVNARVRMEANP